MPQNIIFLIQGEGRGHLTQALSLKPMLEKEGYRVSSVIVGTSPNRKLPDFFLKGIGCTVHKVQSPNFVTDGKAKSVNLRKTIIHNLFKLKTFGNSLSEIDRIVNAEKPVLIINFYEFLAGLYFFWKSPKMPVVSVAHQYCLDDPTFPFPKKQSFSKWLLKLNNKITAFRSRQRWALSFSSEPHTKPGYFTSPPLLRSRLFELTAKKEGHLLCYLVNRGYAKEVEVWALNNPDTEIHCFWDNPSVPKEWSVGGKLTFHQLDDEKFLQLMASASGYISTAGFESICEAHYLGKPMVLVPVEGQFEQYCNGIDAERFGVARMQSQFDERVFRKENWILKEEPILSEFRSWVKSASAFYLHKIKELIGEPILDTGSKSAVFEEMEEAIK